VKGFGEFDLINNRLNPEVTVGDKKCKVQFLKRYSNINTLIPRIGLHFQIFKAALVAFFYTWSQIKCTALPYSYAN